MLMGTAIKNPCCHISEFSQVLMIIKWIKSSADFIQLFESYFAHLLSILRCHCFLHKRRPLMELKYLLTAVQPSTLHWPSSLLVFSQLWKDSIMCSVICTSHLTLTYSRCALRSKVFQLVSNSDLPPRTKLIAPSKFTCFFTYRISFLTSNVGKNVWKHICFEFRTKGTEFSLFTLVTYTDHTRNSLIKRKNVSFM